MNQQPCELVQDILPLYVEESVSETTKAVVEAHLHECSECKRLFAELKNANPVLPDLKESLPEADTFKQWMKRLKTAGIIALILVILAGAGIGILSYEAGNAANNDMLTVKDVTKTLKQAGVKLASASNVNPSDHKMGQVKPSIYQIKELDAVLFIYQFASIGERNALYKQWADESRTKNSESWPYQLVFAAKNTILVLHWPQLPIENGVPTNESALLNIAKTVFYKLNAGQRVVYEGESENWTGKVIVNYYNYVWADEKGTNHYETWKHIRPVLVFKGDAKAIQGEFSYEFNFSSGGTSGSSSDGFPFAQFGEKDSAFNYGAIMPFMSGIGGNGWFVPQDDSVYTADVRWHNQHETLELKRAD